VELDWRWVAAQSAAVTTEVRTFPEGLHVSRRRCDRGHPSSPRLHDPRIFILTRGNKDVNTNGASAAPDDSVPPV
jgi:hypothetical protein